MLDSEASPLSRRALFGGAALVGLTACTPPAPAAMPPAPSTPIRADIPLPPSPSPVPPAPTTQAPTTPAPTPQVPSREEIVARFSGRRPTTWSNGEFNAMPGLLRTTPSDKVVLTLDGCGGPAGSGFDARILDLLRHEGIPAVLFLNRRWIEANRGVFDRLSGERDLLEIGNHGTRHMPLSVTGRSQYKEPGTRDAGEVYDEVMGNHQFLTGLLGTPPRFFRTGTAWYDEVSIDIVHALGEIPVGFDINGDAGTTYPAATVAKETARAKPGSIIICHLNQPKHPTYDGLAQALPAMKKKGVKFARLSDTGV